MLAEEKLTRHALHGASKAELSTVEALLALLENEASLDGSIVGGATGSQEARLDSIEGGKLGDTGETGAEKSSVTARRQSGELVATGDEAFRAGWACDDTGDERDED